MSSPDHHRKKRIGKACDSCRIKKTKCDGRKPCLRCIADNRICSFTDKRKNKEKSHPPGYVDLLETRVELPTRLLEKIINLLEPHLPWLAKLMELARLEHAKLLPVDEDTDKREGYVPINEVVDHLISEHGLLKNLPVDWEDTVADVYRSISKEPPKERDSDNTEDEEFVTRLDQENPQAHGHKRVGRHPLLALDRSVRSGLASRKDLRHQYSSYSSLITDQLSMDGISLAGYGSSNSANVVPQSLFKQETSPLVTRAELHERRPSAQIFADATGASSLLLLLASLAARLENHDIGPTSPSALLLGLALGMTPMNLLLAYSDSTMPSLAVLTTPQPMLQPARSMRRPLTSKDSLFRPRPGDHVHKLRAASHPFGQSHVHSANYNHRQDVPPLRANAPNTIAPTAVPNPSITSPPFLDSTDTQSPEMDDFVTFPLSDDAMYHDLNLDDNWKVFSSAEGSLL